MWIARNNLFRAISLTFFITKLTKSAFFADQTKSIILRKFLFREIIAFQAKPNLGDSLNFGLRNFLNPSHYNFNKNDS